MFTGRKITVISKDSYGFRKSRFNFSAFIVSFLIAAFFVTSTFVLTLSNIPFSVVNAEENDDTKKTKEEISSLADSYIEKDADGKTDLKQLIDKSSKDSDVNSFGYIVNRIFGLNYINATPQATNGGNEQNCNVNAQGAGTPYYHNCNIPSAFTEFAQSVAGVFVTTGVSGANVESAIPFGNFGIPNTDKLPNDKGAPALASSRSDKYTALELFGYNLGYTSYHGEWDNIKVMTSARAMSNFGFMDSLKLGGTAIVKGVANGLGVAATNFADRLSSGDIIGAIGNLWTDFTAGSASMVTRVVLDTSDQNVLNTFSWYRVGYGSTLYNAREMTQAEIGAKAKRSFYAFLLSSAPDETTLPPDLLALTPPEMPKNDVSKCVIRHNGVNVEKTDINSPNGVSEQKCKELAESVVTVKASVVQKKKADDLTQNGHFFWSADGSQKKQSLKDWFKENEAKFATANKYGMEIPTSGEESQRDVIALNIVSNWGVKYEETATKTLQNQQEGLNNKWLEQALVGGGFAKQITENKQANYNAPWNRFVCLNDNGSDMYDGTNLVMLLDTEGNINPKCKPVRPPIQSALFGNGYSDGGPIDTRYTRLEPSFLGKIFPIDSLFGFFANVSLGIASFVTSISNFVMELSFSPVLEQLGLDTVIVSMINYLKASIFFPLIILAVGVAAVMALFNAIKSSAYGKGIVELLLIAGVVFAGVFTLQSPERMVRLVDETPALIEQALVGGIFAAGNHAEDNLCTASQSGDNTVLNDLNGRSTTYDLSTGTRSLMCENWRSFAFNPWVYGQFGTSYDALYANGSGAPKQWKNKNTDLVGDASVYLGAGVFEKNWALYQLSTVTSGTAYEQDILKPSGAVSKDFYRIVDAQAGPNGAKDSHTEFFEHWSGQNWFARSNTAFLGAIASMFGAVTVLAYSFYKIQVTFVATFLLIILPVMLLIGIFPNRGRTRLKAYLFTILGLMAQRVVLVVLLAIMFRVLAGVGTASLNFAVTSIFAIVISVVFLKMRKSVLASILNTIGSSTGGVFGQDFISNPSGFINSKIGSRAGEGRGFIANRATMFSRMTKYSIIGGVAGLATGNNILDTAEKAAAIEKNFIQNAQRRKGFSGFESATQAITAGKKQADKEMRSNIYVGTAKELIVKGTNDYEEFVKKQRAYDSIEAEEQFDKNGQGFKVDDQGVTHKAPNEIEFSEADFEKLSRKDLSKAARGLKKQYRRTYDKIQKDKGGGQVNNLSPQDMISYLTNLSNETDVKDVSEAEKARVNKTLSSLSSRLDKVKARERRRERMRRKLEEMQDNLLGSFDTENSSGTDNSNK